MIFGRPYYRSSLWYSMSSFCLSSVCDVLYCGKTVRPSQKVNKKPGSKSSFFGSPPYFYFRFCRYRHRDGCFCLIFARSAQQSVIDGPNGLSSSKPCAYCQIVWSELKPDSGLFVFITQPVAYVPVMLLSIWTTRPQSMGDGRGLPWALATGHQQCTFHSLPYRLRHRCPTARTAASHTNS